MTTVDDVPSAEMEALRLRRLRAAFRDGPGADAARRSPLGRGLVLGAVLAGLVLLAALVTGVVQGALHDSRKSDAPSTTVATPTTAPALTSVAASTTAAAPTTLARPTTVATPTTAATSTTAKH